MAIQTTFTASEANPIAKEMPFGVMAKTARLDLTGAGPPTATGSITATASCLMLMVKIPDQATILDYQFFIESGGANGTWQLGILSPEGSASSTLTRSAISGPQSDSPSAVNRPIGVNLPLTVSISSECVQRWVWVTAVNSVAISASAIMRLTVYYTMDGA